MGLHKDLSEANLHEPKLVSTATAGQVYLANGAGSGTWTLVGGNKLVVVNALADFPAAAGGTIALAANTSYVLGDNVNIGTDFLTFGNGTALSGFGVFVTTLTYTGTGSMLVGVDVSASVSDITLDCPTAALFNFTESASGGLHALVVRDIVVLNCLRFGTVDKLRGITMKGLLANSCTTGLQITGNVYDALELTSVTLVSTEATFVGIDVANSTHKVVRIDSIILFGGAGSVGLKGDVASANITTGFIASVSNVQFDGVTTPLSGITVDDTRYNFVGNGRVADTMPDAMVSLNSNATATVLSVSTPTLVLGTWSLERASQFTTTAAGRITYIGERDLTTPVIVTMTMEPASGTNKEIRAYIALNGTIITNSGQTIDIDSSDPLQISIPWQLTLSENDFLEVFIENISDSVNVTVIDATFLAR